MPGTPSYTPYDHPSRVPVPVIASFGVDGKIRPLYVRINGESFQIQSAVVKDSSAYVSGPIRFRCQVVDGDCLKPLELTFFRLDGIWTMPKLP